MRTNRKLLWLGWAICILAAVFYSYDIFIRVAPGVMGPQLERDFHLDSTGLGFLSAAYFYAYIAFQLPAGVILDKYKPRLVISGALLLCLLGNFIFSIAPNDDVAVLGRVLMGIGSAFGFIGAAKVASVWLPARFFSSYMSFAVFVGTMGGLVADTVLSALVQHFGWRHGNNIFTYIGVILFALLVWLLGKKPVQVEIPQDGSRSEPLWARIWVLLKILRGGRFWVVSFIGAVLFLPINILASLWGVGFIQAKLGVNGTEAADLNSTIFLGAAVGSLVISAVSIYIKRYRLMLIICCALMASLSILMTYVPMPFWLFSTCLFLLGLSVGPQVLSFEIGKYLSPQGATASAVAGVNMINNALAAILLPLFGWLLSFGVVHAAEVKVLPLHDYYYAMGMTPLLIIICIPLCMLLPKCILAREERHYSYD